MRKELYVRHISAKATEADIRRLFTVAGTVTSVHMITDPVSGQFKGCAFVGMATIDEAKEALETLDGALLIDRVLIVSEARPQKPKANPSPRGGRGRQRR